MVRVSWGAETVHRLDCMTCHFCVFSTSFLYLSPAPVTHKMLWHIYSTLTDKKDKQPLVKPPKEEQSPCIQSKKGCLGNLNTEWRPTAKKERILAILDLLARAVLFFDGLYALEFYAHNISTLNQTRYSLIPVKTCCGVFKWDCSAESGREHIHLFMLHCLK